MQKKELCKRILLIVVTTILQFIMKNDYMLLFIYVWYSYALVSLLMDKVQFSLKYGIGLAIVAFIYITGSSMLLFCRDTLILNTITETILSCIELIFKGICPALVSYINSNVGKNLDWFEKENIAYEQYYSLYEQGYIKEPMDRIYFHIANRRSSKDVKKIYKNNFH